MLTLTQGVNQTVAGYNLYRSIGDSNVYLKINKSLISNEDLQYVDTDVITGQKYYYYFTSVDTDFNESKPSNIFECVPLEIKKPVINKVTVTGTKTGDDIKITADVDNDTYFKNMTLYYKYDASYTWNVINMQNNGSYVYEAVIPSDKVKEGNLEYYIEASDSFNKANYGSRSNPCIIKITSSAIITQITTTIATTTTTTTTKTVNAPNILSLIISEAKANETIKAYAEIYGSGYINTVLKYKYENGKVYLWKI